jgi:hypothetical protein
MRVRGRDWCGRSAWRRPHAQDLRAAGSVAAEPRVSDARADRSKGLRGRPQRAGSGERHQEQREA